jgi:hypothetical protein
MGWIENRPNKFLNQNFVRQGLPAKSKSVRFRLNSLKYTDTPIQFAKFNIILNKI